MATAIRTYFDYKSPYAYVARHLIYDLAGEFSIDIEWIPYTINISDAVGSAEVNEKGELLVDRRSAHQWRRIRYMYMDCRRLARERGLSFHSPYKVFRSRVAHIGALFAKRFGAFRAYHDMAFDLFWTRRLDLDDVAAIGQVLTRAGVDPSGFAEFAAGDGGREHHRLIEEAHALGVFGVPSFIVDGELFWGSEHLPTIRRRLASVQLRGRNRARPVKPARPRQNDNSPQKSEPGSNAACSANRPLPGT